MNRIILPCVTAHAVLLSLLLLGCAKVESPSYDITLEHGYDIQRDPVVDTIAPDYPVDTGYDPRVDPVYDPVYDPGIDPVYDIGIDTGSCSESPCGLKPNCGCPSGWKCSLDDAAARTCIPAGSGGIGATCLDDSECTAGYICLGTNPEGTTGACYAYCNSDSDCSGSGSICFQLGQGGVPIPGANTCSYSCNLPSSTGCPAGHTCDLYGLDENGDTVSEKDFTDCNSEVGSGTQDAYCTLESDCAPGFVCYTTDGICLGYCYVASPSCTGGWPCTTLDVFIGGQEIGVCY